MRRLTDTQIRSLTPRTARYEVADAATPGLRVRVSPTGARSWVYVYRQGGALRRLTLGQYPALSLAQARAAAAKAAAEREDGADPAAIKSRATAARRARQAHTLGDLVDTYAAHLDQHDKRASATDVRSCTRHLGDLRALAAAEVQPQHLRDVLGELVQADKGRTAAKLRSYLRAAYALALRAEFDPSAPGELREFGVEGNPCDRLPALTQFSRARHRALSWDELRAVYRALDERQALGSVAAVAVLCSLLLGGQRIQQVLRTRVSDVDLTRGSERLVLLDPKGRRHEPRRHVVPVPAEAVPLLQRRIAEAREDGYLFPGRTAGTAVHPETVSILGRKVSEELVQRGLLREPAQVRDLRRTVETLLAGMGVSRDLRAQLQSHGLGGIQARHYDRHDYLPELREVLRRWAAEVTRTDSAVRE